MLLNKRDFWFLRVFLSTFPMHWVKTFRIISSSSNYSQQFQDIKVGKERENLNFQLQNNEKYNLPFKLSKLKNSLDKCNDTTACPDDIHY